MPLFPTHHDLEIVPDLDTQLSFVRGAFERRLQMPVSDGGLSLTLAEYYDFPLAFEPSPWNKQLRAIENLLIREDVEKYRRSGFFARFFARLFSDIETKIMLAEFFDLRSYQGDLTGVVSRLEQMTQLLGRQLRKEWVPLIHSLKAIPSDQNAGVFISQLEKRQLSSSEALIEHPARRIAPSYLLKKQPGSVDRYLVTDEIRVFCDRLGLGPHDFSREEVRAAYKKQVLQEHPDKATGNRAIFQKIQQAHDYLIGLIDGIIQFMDETWAEAFMDHLDSRYGWTDILDTESPDIDVVMMMSPEDTSELTSALKQQGETVKEVSMALTDIEATLAMHSAELKQYEAAFLAMLNPIPDESRQRFESETADFGLRSQPMMFGQLITELGSPIFQSACASPSQETASTEHSVSVRPQPMVVL